LRKRGRDYDLARLDSDAQSLLPAWVPANCPPQCRRDCGRLSASSGQRQACLFAVSLFIDYRALRVGDRLTVREETDD